MTTFFDGDKLEGLQIQLIILYQIFWILFYFLFKGLYFLLKESREFINLSI